MTNHAKNRPFPRYLLRTGLAVAAAAVLGGVSTDPKSSWYRGLRKPRWQPPSQTFAVVWPPLYALIAYAGARALTTAPDADRGPLARSFAANLILNGAWTPLFFRAHAPRLALADLALLNASNADLLRRFGRADRRAALALSPYVAWTSFATALNASIAARNPETA